MTIEQIILIFKDVADRHKQINGFKVSEGYNFGVIDDNNYPALLLTPTNPNLPRDENGFSMFTTTFELKIVDLVNDDLDNKIHVFSDAVEILKDIVNEFNTHEYYIDLGLDIISDASMEKLDGITDSDLYGYGTELTIAMPNKLSFCTAPISNLSGFNFSPAAVTVTDGLTEVVLYPSDTYTCTPLVSADDIAYCRPALNGQTTSYRADDYGSLLAAGVYDYTPPVYPESFAEISDSSFLVLNSNNAFANTNRFTDINGLQVYGDDYLIDHHTGLGWYIIPVIKLWEDGIDDSAASTQNGYSDWRLPSANEQWSIYDKSISDCLDYAPFNYGQSTNVITSNTSAASTLQYTTVFPRNGGIITRTTKSTNTGNSFLVRNHYT